MGSVGILKHVQLNSCQKSQLGAGIWFYIHLEVNDAYPFLSLYEKQNTFPYSGISRSVIRARTVWQSKALHPFLPTFFGFVEMVQLKLKIQWS